jgi:uncharacterized membrane protein YedE/YeeE
VLYLRSGLEARASTSDSQNIGELTEDPFLDPALDAFSSPAAAAVVCNRGVAMPLILNHVSPIPWALAGAGIAAVTLSLLFLTNRRLGISTSLEDVCSLLIAAPYFRRGAVRSGRRWRLPFGMGLVLGGFLSALLSGGWAPTWDLGMFDQVVGFGPAGKVVWMFAGGLLIGFGTRLAGGCTSGHGIFGLSNLELPSLISTVSFMASGIVTTQLVYRVIFH